MKSFESWTYEEVQKTFGIKQLEEHEILNKWLSSDIQVSEQDKPYIEKLRKTLKKQVDAWNEDEMKFHFIGPFMQYVDFMTDKYKSFTQRSLHLKTDKVDTGGRVDFMVSTGIQKPDKPFFFFNEYKPSKKGQCDPLGQLLIEMVTAQQLNTNARPVYGAYTEGRFWYFVILTEKEYIVSPSYDATKNDIYQIYAILCKTKEFIEEILKTIAQ